MGVIVVGVDGSELSRVALRWAEAVATARGDRLRVVSAWQYPAHLGTPIGTTSPASPGEVDRQVEAEVRATLHEELGERADEVDVRVARGPAADALLDAASGSAVHALVVGARGVGGVARVVLGSVSQQCVERAVRPVVVIESPATTDASPPEALLVGLDGSDDGVVALDWAIATARATGARIVAVHAVGIGPSRNQLEAAERELHAWAAPLRDAGIDHVTVVGDGDARTVLTEVAQEHDVDLVVVGTRGLGPVPGLLLGSVAGYLVRYADRPVAVVPGVERRR